MTDRTALSGSTNATSKTCFAAVMSRGGQFTHACSLLKSNTYRSTLVALYYSFIQLIETKTNLSYRQARMALIGLAQRVKATTLD